MENNLNYGKEINNLINKIQSNREFEICNSKYYEPWDIDSNTKEDMMNSFYYLLCDCLTTLQKLSTEN